MQKQCLIEIFDYKNIRLHGLTPETRRKCVNRLKFKDPKARYTPAVRLGRWDGTVSFCTVGGATYLNFLPVLLEIVMKEGYDIDIKDHRPDINLKFQPIDNQIFSNVVWPSGKFAGQNIILHDHQVEAVNALLKHDSATIVAATSAGKSFVNAALCLQAQQYGRTVTIVPNRDLVDQTYDDFKMLGLDVGKIYHGQRDLDNTHIITTWQSLHSINNKSKDQLTNDEIERLCKDVIMTIQDEVHLAASKVMFDINARVFKDVPLSYGLTGTIPKEDHLRESIRANFGEVVYTIPAHELQEKGILAKCEVELHQVELEKTVYSDYHAEKKAINTNTKVLQMLANDVIGLTSGDKSNTLILVENLDTGELLEKLIPNSIFLNGSVKSSERKKEYKDVANTEDKVIIATYGIASTGISINRLFHLILFNPGKSFTRTIQSIGRGLRVAEDKDFVAIRDYSFNTKYSKKHLGERKSYYKESKYPFTLIKRKL